jgi:hypothetical protein
MTMARLTERDYGSLTTEAERERWARLANGYAILQWLDEHDDEEIPDSLTQLNIDTLTRRFPDGLARVWAQSPPG